MRGRTKACKTPRERDVRKGDARTQDARRKAGVDADILVEPRRDGQEVMRSQKLFTPSMKVLDRGEWRLASSPTNVASNCSSSSR
jgi:hypothetical protein